MIELFRMFMQHVVWALMLWVVLFVAFAAIFARGQLTAFASGVGRVLLSIIVSPFIFIRKAVGSVLGFTRAEEQAYRASNQYLLNKAMLVLQAMVIVAAIGALAAGVVATWVTLVPPSEVRRAASQYRKDTEAQRVKAAETAAALSKAEAEWAQKREGAIARYRDERKKSIASAAQSMTGYEQSLVNYSQERARQAFAEIRQRAGRAFDSRREIYSMKERLDQNVPGVWYWGIIEWERQTMLEWNANWLAKTIAQFELDHLPVDEIRATAQPAYAETKTASDREAETLSGMEATLLQHQEAASLKFRAAGMRALRSFVTFLLFVWMAGLVIEAGWLAIRIADDVRRMRETSLPPAASAPETTEADVRLPLRDVVPTRGVPAPYAGT
jgi:hypothetical protein